MKTIITTFILSILIIQSMFSQNNSLIVYSQDGLKFTVILNGIRQNADPETNVKITGLNAPNYQVKVIFANNMPDLNQNAYLMFGGNLTQNTEYSYAIVNVKGTYKLKFKSTAPIPEATMAPDPQQTVVMYSPTDVIGTNVTTTTTTNTMGANTNVGGGSVGVNVNAGGVGVGVNMNVVDPSGMNMTNSNSTTTYSTTTTTTTTGGNEMNVNNGTYVLQGYNGVYGCPYPMSEGDFESAKKSIASKGFDESKLTIAKQIIGSNCLLCSQIKELMLLMSFEQTRLDLAKFAWSHNLDRGNYYKLNDAFSFESSINELNEYTQSH